MLKKVAISAHHLGVLMVAVVVAAVALVVVKIRRPRAV